MDYRTYSDEKKSQGGDEEKVLTPELLRQAADRRVSIETKTGTVRICSIVQDFQLTLPRS